ncbi:MAG TPA: NfeD family protein [Candidatus Stackebrandtia excrementipullorum]|nr:NfeD family protein [Candidatus Stackebrandtia excrementipullorum]
MEWTIWLVVAVALGIAELLSLTFVLLMVAGGAAAAAVAAGLGAPLEIQGLVFVAVSTLSLILVRPVAKKWREGHVNAADSIGLEALKGGPALVLERVDNHGGLVKVDGDVWTARAFDGDQVLEPGEEVNVVEIRGATALVWRQT